MYVRTVQNSVSNAADDFRVPTPFSVVFACNGYDFFLLSVSCKYFLQLVTDWKYVKKRVTDMYLQHCTFNQILLLFFRCRFRLKRD